MADQHMQRGFRELRSFLQDKEGGVLSFLYHLPSSYRTNHFCFQFLRPPFAKLRLLT